MSESKYFDYTNGKRLHSESDGCHLADWHRLYRQYAFARHPDGFRVFLPPGRINKSDEYAEADPYTVEETINEEFHSRRIEITIDMVREAISMQDQISQILDLGCGQGHITEKIRRALKDVELSGLDYSISAIEYAHEHFPEIDFAVGDAYESPYATGFFDVVVCNNLWEHVPDPLVLLSRIKRVIKPGGYLVVSTPSRYRIGNLIRILLGKPVVFMSRHHVTEYTVGQVKEQLRYGGFEVKRVLSRPISTGSLKTKVARKVVGSVLSRFIAMVRSHHQLESTVFYLAQEASGCTSQGDFLENGIAPQDVRK